MNLAQDIIGLMQAIETSHRCVCHQEVTVYGATYGTDEDQNCDTSALLLPFQVSTAGLNGILLRRLFEVSADRIIRVLVFR